MSLSREPEQLLLDFPLVLAGESAKDFDPRAFAGELVVARAMSRSGAPTEDEPNPSQAALDQGHAGSQLELGTPIVDEDHPRRRPEAIAKQKADQANRRKRMARRVRETRFTDVGSDQPTVPEEDPDTARVQLGDISDETRSLFRRALGVAEAKSIASEDAKTGAARMKKRDDNPKFPHK